MNTHGEDGEKRPPGGVPRPAEARHAADLVLAQRAAEHDEQAWRLIYERTHERIFALLAYLTGDREEARELLQETYLCALRGIRHFRGEGALEGWFAVIAIRRARDWRRHLYALKHCLRRLARTTPAVLRAAECHDRRILDQALARLDGRQRAAFLLREMQGLSFRQIGGALGCAECTARVHYFRARGRMRQEIGGEDDVSAPQTNGGWKPSGAVPEALSSSGEETQ